MEVIYTAQNTELFITFQILRCHTLKLNISAPNHGSDSVKAILVLTNTPISVGSRSARVLSLSQQCLAWHVRSSQGALFSLCLTFLDFTGTPEGKWQGPQLSWPPKMFGGSMAQRLLLCYTPSLCFYFSPPWKYSSASGAQDLFCMFHKFTWMHASSNRAVSSQGLV